MPRQTLLILQKAGKLLAAWAAVMAVCYTLLESAFFCCTSFLFPYAARVSFGFGIYPLLQTSKSGVIPQHYTAIFGDSFGFGAGDDFFRLQHQSNPKFNVTHLLHDKTGRDYVSFAIPGSSNLCGWIEDPIASMNYINATRLYHIDNPDEILLYFYEGNDMEDSWKDLQERYINNGYSMENLEENSYFSNFIQHEMLDKNQINLSSRQLKTIDNLMLFRYIRNVVDESRNREKVLALLKEIKPPEDAENNIVMINGQPEHLPDNLQAPPITMEPMAREQTIRFISRIARYVRNTFPLSRMSIIYIPATTTSYRMTSATANIYNPDQPNVFPVEKLNAISNALCNDIRTIAIRNQINFHDTRPGILKHGQQARLHGPWDMGHFNLAGYRALAEEIEQFSNILESTSNPVTATDCATL